MTICDNCGSDGAERVKPLRNTKNADYDMNLCAVCLIDFRNWNKEWANQYGPGKQKERGIFAE